MKHYRISILCPKDIWTYTFLETHAKILHETFHWELQGYLLKSFQDSHWLCCIHFGSEMAPIDTTAQRPIWWSWDRMTVAKQWNHSLPKGSPNSSHWRSENMSHGSVLLTPRITQKWCYELKKLPYSFNSYL